MSRSKCFFLFLFVFWKGGCWEVGRGVQKVDADLLFFLWVI